MASKLNGLVVVLCITPANLINLLLDFLDPVTVKKGTNHCFDVVLRFLLLLGSRNGTTHM